MYMLEMNINPPGLEYSRQLQLSLLPLHHHITALIDVEYFVNVLFSLIREEDFLVGIEFVDDYKDEFVDELGAVDV